MTAANAGADIFRLSPFLARLRSGLSALSVAHKVAFGLYCSERLYPSYAALAKQVALSSPGNLRDLLDAWWQHVEDGRLTHQQVSLFADQLQQVDLGEEGSCPEWDAAVDAVGAAALTLEAWRRESAEHAARAGGNVLNRVHQQLVDEELGAVYVIGADDAVDLNRSIERHPLMQAAQDRLAAVVEILSARQPLSASDVQHLRSLAELDSRHSTHAA